MKFMLRIGTLKTINDNQIELNCIKTDELIIASYSKNIKSYPDLVVGADYDIVVSPYETNRGRLIYSRKNYDLDLSLI